LALPEIKLGYPDHIQSFTLSKQTYNSRERYYDYKENSTVVRSGLEMG
jgi:hypothetical protein